MLTGLLAGLTDKEIARRMGITFGGVHGHVKLIYKEYGVHSRGELRRR